MCDSFVTPWTTTHQAPPSMGFSRQEYWSGWPCPSPGDIPHPEIKPVSPMSPVLVCGFLTTEPPLNINCLKHFLLLLSRFSRVRLCATPQTAAHQAPPSLGFSRQEYWSGLPFPSPGDLPNPGIKPVSPMSPVLAGRFLTTEPPGKAKFN